MLTPEAKGQRAQQILDDDVFKEAQETARKTLIDRWIRETDRDARDRLWHEYQALGATTTALRVIAGDGDVARHSRQKKERSNV